MKQLLTIGISPNVESDDIAVAARQLIRPPQYRHGTATADLQNTLTEYFQAKSLWLTNSGRTALLLYLQALQLPPDSEVLLQAFTCNAVTNPILWAGLQPVYVDIDEDSYTMSAADLEHKISTCSRVLIIQHTFGRPAELDRLLAIARRHNLIVIEDCAHALGARYHEKLLGTFGDAAILSFGRDKVISSVYGGALIVNTTQPETVLAELYQTLPYPTTAWTIQQLVHPLITRLAVRTWYWWRLGQIFFWCAQRLQLVSLAVSQAERVGKKPAYFPARLPNALAVLALNQFKKLDRFNTHRRKIAALYQAALQPNTPLADTPPDKALAGSIYLRYTWRTKSPQTLAKKLAQHGIIVGDWYWSVIAPATTDLTAMHYQPGSCPTAERVAQSCINLPTHINITPHIAETIIQELKTSEVGATL